MYVNDIIISGDDSNFIAQFKIHLGKQFHTKNLGLIRYFFGIKVVRSNEGISLWKQKYVLDL